MKTKFKASKTVIALALAGLISGGAFAADPANTNPWLDDKNPIKEISSDMSVTVGAKDEVVHAGQNTTAKDITVLNGATLSITDGNRLINWAGDGMLTLQNGSSLVVAGATKGYETPDDTTNKDVWNHTSTPPHSTQAKSPFMTALR